MPAPSLPPQLHTQQPLRPPPCRGLYHNHHGVLVDFLPADSKHCLSLTHAPTLVVAVGVTVLWIGATYLFSVGSVGVSPLSTSLLAAADTRVLIRRNSAKLFMAVAAVARAPLFPPRRPPPPEGN